MMKKLSDKFINQSGPFTKVLDSFKDWKRGDYRYSFNILSELPEELQCSIAKKYIARYRHNTKKANLWLFEYKEINQLIKKLANQSILKPFSKQSDIELKAVECVDWCLRCKNVKEIKQFFDMCGIDKPNARTDEGFINRSRSRHFWQKKLIVASRRLDEHIRIISGLTHRKAGVYVSNYSLNNYIDNLTESRKFIDASEVINKNTGEILPLKDVFNGSLANPVNRRAELMVHLGGLEYTAKKSGHKSVFITLTTPSKYHSITSKNYQLNEKYNGSTPKQAQQYLCSVWSRIRAAFDDNELSVYGMRVAEPHHDGTPHWHMILFGSESDLKQAYQIIREQALKIDGNEKGAQKKRTDIEWIDTKKGSALAYVAKYVSKNIDGMETAGAENHRDYEAGTEKNTALRVRAWASLWGIRQFQFFGDIPVQIWRELRRLKTSNHELINQAINEAKASKKENYGELINLVGGVMKKRSELNIQIHKVQVFDVNKWGEKRPDKITGLKLGGDMEEVKEKAKLSLLAAISIADKENTDYFAGILDSYNPEITRPDEWEMHTDFNNLGVDFDFQERSDSWIHLNNCRNDFFYNNTEKIDYD